MVKKVRFLTSVLNAIQARLVAHNCGYLILVKDYYRRSKNIYISSGWGFDMQVATHKL